MKELKGINIKGNEYILVKDRVLYFNENYPNGKIETELLSEINSEMVVMKATITPDVDNPTRIFTGFSQATWAMVILIKLQLWKIVRHQQLVELLV